MKAILSEKNIVVVLFVIVLVTFVLAQEDSKQLEKLYSSGSNPGKGTDQLVHHFTTKSVAIPAQN